MDAMSREIQDKRAKEAADLIQLLPSTLEVPGSVSRTAQNWSSSTGVKSPHSGSRGKRIRSSQSPLATQRQAWNI